MTPGIFPRRQSSGPNCLRSTGLALAAAVVFAAPAVASSQHRAPRAVIVQNFHRTLPLPAGGVFSLMNVNGSVAVEGWSRDEVQISAIATAPRDAAERSGVKIDVQAQPGAVTVRTIYPQGEGVDVSVEFRVRVPRRVILAGVVTVNGSVRVRGVEGAGDLRTVNGNVEMFDGAGRFEARSTNGNIYMELRRLGDAGESEAATLETVNGTVVLSLPAETDSDLEIHSLNGDFSSELPVERRASSGGRELRCRLGAGGSPLRIRTMNGAVRLLMARPLV